MTGKIYRPDQQHPEGPQQDPNPDANAGQNYGLIGPHPEKDNPRTAYDVKDVHNRLRDYTDDELKQIPVLPAGARLEQGATYLDLRSPTPQEFSALGDQEAGPDNLYVPKTDVPYELWNRLIGVSNPYRTGEERRP
jgi:hypothetical protein